MGARAFHPVGSSGFAEFLNIFYACRQRGGAPGHTSSRHGFRKDLDSTGNRRGSSPSEKVFDFAKRATVTMILAPCGARTNKGLTAYL